MVEKGEVSILSFSTDVEVIAPEMRSPSYIICRQAVARACFRKVLYFAGLPRDFLRASWRHRQQIQKVMYFTRLPRGLPEGIGKTGPIDTRIINHYEH